MGQESEYLKEIGRKIQQSIANMTDLDEGDQKTDHTITELLETIIEFESGCRDKHQIGARFGVIQNQLKELLKLCKHKLGEHQPVEVVEEDKAAVGPDEDVVYVYLFNAQGAKLNTWTHVLSVSAMVDHSINRPIYGKKEDIEEFLRSKIGKEHHAFAKVKVKKDNVLMSLESSVLKDSLGNLLMRLKQGALHTENILGFYHRDKEYALEHGELVLRTA